MQIHCIRFFIYKNFQRVIKIHQIHYHVPLKGGPSKRRKIYTNILTIDDN